MEAAEAVFLRCSLRKLFLNSWSILNTDCDLPKVVPATLLKSLYVMGIFLEVGIFPTSR